MVGATNWFVSGNPCHSFLLESIYTRFFQKLRRDCQAMTADDTFFSFHCLLRRFVSLFLLIWLPGYVTGVIASRSNSWLSTTVFANTKSSPCAWILFVPVLLKIAPHVLEQSVLQVFLVKKVHLLFYDIHSEPCTVPEF